MKSTKTEADGSINSYLMRKRIELNLTQSEVAKKLNLNSPQYISNIERNLCKPSLDTVNQLISIYKLDRHEVIELMLSDYKNSLVSNLTNNRKKMK